MTLAFKRDQAERARRAEERLDLRALVDNDGVSLQAWVDLLTDRLLNAGLRFALLFVRKGDEYPQTVYLATNADKRKLKKTLVATASEIMRPDGYVRDVADDDKYGARYGKADVAAE